MKSIRTAPGNVTWVRCIAATHAARRCLVTLALLGGLFLMHGLTTDHTMAMPMTETVSGPLPQVTAANPMDTGAPKPPARETPGKHLTLDQVVSAMPGGGMGTACLALLGAGLLWPLLVGRRVRRRANNYLGTLATALRARNAVDAVHEFRHPQLMQLGISRT